jgi:hypothetical protein
MLSQGDSFVALLDWNLGVGWKKEIDGFGDGSWVLI